MKVLCVIPSRLGSTRLTRKALRLIGGKAMVQRTYEGAVRCKTIAKVVVATDSAEIAAVITACGGEAVMTPESIRTGTDRVALVAERFLEYDVVINLQGDEPFIQPDMLTTLVQPFLNGEPCVMSTTASPLQGRTEYLSPDIVKVLVDCNSDAILFSRSPIPFLRQEMDLADLPVLHHMGLYAFKRDFLLRYAKMPQTKLEQAESLEQMRALENGYRIRVCPVKEQTLEINNPAELALAEEWIKTREP